MINIELIKVCEECNKLASISELYIDDKTSEEEYLVKEYINYIVDKRFKVRD